jgi:hypothetical protein
VAANARIEESLRGCGDPSFETVACAWSGPPLQRTFEKLDAVLNQFPDDKLASSMWNVVHATSLAGERFAGSSDAHKAQFNRLATFVLRCYVPSSLRCRRCSKLWNAALRDASPIPTASRFAKTVELHNDVNAIIGKGYVAEVDARAMYAWAALTSSMSSKHESGDHRRRWVCSLGQCDGLLVRVQRHRVPARCHAAGDRSGGRGHSRDLQGCGGGGKVTSPKRVTRNHSRYPVFNYDFVMGPSLRFPRSCEATRCS